jgi:hypothetical protein
MIKAYDVRMSDIEKALKGIIVSMQEEKTQKISQSFCLGVDHSMLLSGTPVVIQNVRNKYIINNHHTSNEFGN